MWRRPGWDEIATMKPASGESWIFFGELIDVCRREEKSGGRPVPPYKLLCFNDTIQ